MSENTEIVKWEVMKIGSKRVEISVKYGGENHGHGWPDVNKFIMPEPNPGTPEQYEYFEMVAGLLADVLNVNQVVPYEEPSPDDEREDRD